MKKVLFCTVLMSLSLLSIPFAAAPYPGFYLGDSKREVSNGYEVGVTLTKPADNVRWATEANLGVIASSKLYFTYGLNLIYNVLPYSNVIPYVFTGIGGDIGQNSFYAGLNVGAGLKFILAPDWIYSLQTRHIWYGERDSEWMFAGILNVPFGNRKETIVVVNNTTTNYREPVAVIPAKAIVDSQGQFLGINLDINFETDSDVVSPIYAEDLKDFAYYLKKHPEQKIEIQGHTDDEMSKLNDNLDLSYRRAYSVAKVLIVKYGVSTDQLIVKGYGSLKPLVKNNSKDSRSMNRRIQAVLVKQQ
ncbi:MAG: OmpA family protein [Candidatus Margulisbacteria bacterium]|nr:OmpA family protein [Candidatus Margulisiibacteriota bacterium]